MNKVIYEGYANGFYSFQNFSKFLKSRNEVFLVRERDISDMDAYFFAHFSPGVTLQYLSPVLNGSKDRKKRVILTLIGNNEDVETVEAIIKRYEQEFNLLK